MIKKCCATCFGDNGLRELISFMSFTTGTCSYCKTGSEIVVEPALLEDCFGTLLNVYEPHESGKLLSQCLREDWAFFVQNQMDEANAQMLLGDIFNDGQIVRKKFIPSPRFQTDRLGKWEELRKELMHENRFFPETEIDFERLELLLSRLKTKTSDVPNDWYRARIQFGDQIFIEAEMLAPPPRIASHGRANPAGIPYLYLASEIVTAVSEIRPHAGEIVCVANFLTQPDLLLVDLRHPRVTVSPFLFDDESDIGQMRSDLNFLERLGDELTRPVRAQAAAFDYTPSQYLCEFIKKCKYDGVIYRSSVSDGMNLALFNPVKATIGKIRQHEVTQVNVEVGEPIGLRIVDAQIEHY
jgi:hypothetical protein